MAPTKIIMEKMTYKEKPYWHVTAQEGEVSYLRSIDTEKELVAYLDELLNKERE